jgi:polar amino acid transport system substrate-binding protein
VKNKAIAFFVITGLFLLWLINLYFVNAYDVNIYNYVRYSRGLNNTERVWLINHGPIIYGADKSTPPLRYQDTESEQYMGVVIDYISSLSIELVTEIKLKPLVWREALASLEAGKTDICDMFPSEQRASKYLFSDPIYNLRGITLKRATDDRINHPGDLAGKRVAAVRGDYSIEFLNARVKNIDFVFTDDVFSAVQYLQSGVVDAVVGDEPVIIYDVEKVKGKNAFRILDQPLYELNVVFAVPKAESQLVGILNKGIFAIKRKQVLEKIQQKWFGISAPILRTQVSRAGFILVLVATILAMMILFALYVANERLKNKVLKQTEELFLSRDDLQKTFDGIPFLMVVFDHALTIVNVNRAFSVYAGLPATKVMARNWRDIRGNLGFDDELEAMVLETFSDARERNSEIQYKGRVFQVNSFALLGKDGLAIKVVAAIRDVTEAKISQKQFLQASKMAAVGQLAAGIAHEIRNPLGLIRSYTYILKEEIGQDKPNARKAIAVVEDAVERAHGIIGNLLSFSSISGDRLQRVDVGRMIQNILALEHKILQRLKITVRYERSERIFRINPESLKHILINLISNAIDAMPDGGTLTLGCECKDHALHLTVADTGAGISPQHLDSLFHPFFTTKPPGKGTGLGLYITYNEVQKSGGEIKVTSELGAGSTFQVTLPLAKEEQDEA